MRVRLDRLLTALTAVTLTAGLLTAGTTSSAASSAATSAQPAGPPRPAGQPAVPAPAPAAGPAAPRPAAPAPAAAAPAPVGPAVPQAGCPLPPRPHTPFVPPRPRPPRVAETALPAPLPARPKAASLAAVSGKGIWVTNWPDTTVDVPAVVTRARRSGLRSIWVRTGGTRQGYYGQTVLPRLVPAAHAAGLAVLAWDFPALSDPVADAQRARAALASGIDGFAPDIETAYEGTYPTARRVALYLSLVRAYAGDRVVAATVPRPTPSRRASFPYAAFPAYADVFVPMVYWSCNEPGRLVGQSLRELGRLLPVHPVGQGYDMGSEGGRRGLPTYRETLRFVDYARRGGAVGASLWTYEKVGAGQWLALSGYRWPGRPQ